MIKRGPEPAQPWEDPRFDEGRACMAAGLAFEAHEHWEALWRDLPPGDERRWCQGLIHLAVAVEHHRRGNAVPAAGQWNKACVKLHDVPPLGTLDAPALREALRELFEGRSSAVPTLAWVAPAHSA